MGNSTKKRMKKSEEELEESKWRKENWDKTVTPHPSTPAGDANYMQTVPDSHRWTNIQMLLNYLEHHKNGNVPANYLIIGLQNTKNDGYDLAKPSPQSEQAGEKEDYQAVAANALEWLVLLSSALRELVELKKIKDSEGKTTDYEQRQPLAWKMAFDAIELLKKDDGYFKKLPSALWQAASQKKAKLIEETVRQIAWVAWKGAANAYRLYPDNKHTFVGYWDAAKNQFEEFFKPTV